MTNNDSPICLTQTQPEWFMQLFGLCSFREGEQVTLANERFSIKNGLLRADSVVSKNQQQTKETFGFKWQKRNTFESEASLNRMRAWLIERYGDVSRAKWWDEYKTPPLVIDAGCGAAMSAIELLGAVIPKIRYLGVDISSAIDVGATRFAELGLEGAFLQADITRIPLPNSSVDLIFSEGVLHHTDSTENSLKKISRFLKPGGRFLFYVYNKKGPIREFTDDYIRSQLQEMTPEKAWSSLNSLTKLGKILGELNIEIELPESIDLLKIPEGKIDLQRLFYWHIFKIFYRSDLTLEEMNHINFDWYTPANAHRQTPEDVRNWCSEAELEIEREVIEPAGITIIARKKITSST